MKATTLDLGDAASRLAALGWSPDLRRYAVHARGKGVTCFVMARNETHSKKVARGHGLTVLRNAFSILQH